MTTLAPGTDSIQIDYTEPEALQVGFEQTSFGDRLGPGTGPSNAITIPIGGTLTARPTRQYCDQTARVGYQCQYHHLKIRSRDVDRNCCRPEDLQEPLTDVQVVRKLISLVRLLNRLVIAASPAFSVLLVDTGRIHFKVSFIWEDVDHHLFTLAWLQLLSAG